MSPYRKSTWMRWFLSIPEPRSVRFGYLVAYLLWAVAGVSVLISPPTSLEGTVGPVLTYTWGSFLALGSIIGASTVLTIYWWAERLAIWLTGTGVAVYAILIVSMHLTSAGNRIPQLCFVLAGLAFLIVRYFRIKGARVQPGK